MDISRRILAMQRVIFFSVVLWCVLLLGAAHAEVITIEGTVKSVDAAKRTITVETEGEEKTLDVSSKAKISVEENDTKLDSLKPDQKVKLSYHDELEIVLKIEGIPVVQNDSLVGATLYQGHHYKVFREAGLDWKTAKTRCEAMGGHLVTINNERENKFITALATKTIGDINNSGIWLGATDERKDGKWEWIDGTPFNFSAWNKGQGSRNTVENYLLLLLYFKGPGGNEVRGWCDQPNEGKIHVIYYACEWDQ